jgi:hypothetical protein
MSPCCRPEEKSQHFITPLRMRNEQQLNTGTLYTAFFGWPAKRPSFTQIKTKAKPLAKLTKLADLGRLQYREQQLKLFLKRVL